MTTIGVMDRVSPSDTLTVTLSYGSLLPEFFLSESGVREAITPLGFNVLMVDVDTLVGFRKIIIQFHPATHEEAGVIGKQLEDAIRNYFYSVWEVNAEKYELGSGIPTFSTQTTISLTAIAILAILGIGLFAYFGGFRR